MNPAAGLSPGKSKGSVRSFPETLLQGRKESIGRRVLSTAVLVIFDGRQNPGWGDRHLTCLWHTSFLSLGHRTGSPER